MKSVGNRILDYMTRQGYLINDCNIVYIEGVDPDTFALNDDALDYWNDTRNIILSDGTILMSCSATTEPGKYYTENPLNPSGAARIAFGQHKDAWAFGNHKDQKALVQVGEITVFRDFNEDGLRTGDKTYTGLFGINQHTTASNALGMCPEEVGRWSAGCLVGKVPRTHYEIFLPTLRKFNYPVWDTTVLDGTLLHRLGVLSAT